MRLWTIQPLMKEYFHLKIMKNLKALLKSFNKKLMPQNLLQVKESITRANIKSPSTRTRIQMMILTKKMNSSITGFQRSVSETAQPSYNKNMMTKIPKKSSMRKIKKLQSNMKRRQWKYQKIWVVKDRK